MTNVPKSGQWSEAGDPEQSGTLARGPAEDDRGGKPPATSALGEPEKGKARRGLPQAEERELILRAQRGDVSAYEELLRTHQQRVFAIVGGILRRREDVEDVVQQVFIKVYVSIRQFDLRSAFSTWLYKIAVNECYDYLRKKRVRRLVYEADLSEEQVRQLEALDSGTLRGSSGQAGIAPAADASQRAEMRQLAGRLLDELQEEDRHMLVLKEVEGLSVAEISEALGINVNTVKVRLFRARGRLVDIYRKRLRDRSRRPR